MDTGPDAQVQDLTGCLGSNPSPALCQGHTLGNSVPPFAHLEEGTTPHVTDGTAE